MYKVLFAEDEVLVITMYISGGIIPTFLVIFQEDLVHYISQTQRWFAWWQWERLIQGKWVS